MAVAGHNLLLLKGADPIVEVVTVVTKTMMLHLTCHGSFFFVFFFCNLTLVVLFICSTDNVSFTARVCDRQNIHCVRSETKGAVKL